MTHTPTPWAISPPWSGFSKISGPNGELIFGLAAGGVDEKRSDDECDDNAAFLLRAVNNHHALLDAAHTFKAWLDHEDRSPDYGEFTRETHPEGERIWREWWQLGLDLCRQAQDKARAALAAATESET
jgi:hypothetical protein